MRQRNDVDLDHLRFVVPIRLKKGTASTEAGIVHQDIDSNPRLLQLLIKLPGRRWMREIFGRDTNFDAVLPPCSCSPICCSAARFLATRTRR